MNMSEFDQWSGNMP